MFTWQQWTQWDMWLTEIDKGVRTVFAKAITEESSPGKEVPEGSLSSQERKEASRLMRVNHAGEVCAQALYRGHALVSSDEAVRTQLLKAAEEENAHLAWCEDRIGELGGEVSKLNPLWYGGSFLIGYFSAWLGKAYALGFVLETENQVVKHLQRHQNLLPRNDGKSHRILEQMCLDEQKHADEAMLSGAVELPSGVKKIMAQCSKVMVSTAYWL